MKSITKKLYSHRYALITGFIMLWLFVAFFLLQEIKFETNDDSAMARIVYGINSTDYDPYLVFINILVGKCLVFMLQLFPNIPWYTVFQCSLVFISFSVIIYLLFKRFGISKGFLPVFLFILFFGNQYFLLLQFTKTASISVIAGILLIFDAVTVDSKRNIWKYVLGGFLTIAGSLYRFNSFGMMAILLCGVGITIIWEPLTKMQWKKLVNIALPFVIVFALCVGFRCYNNWSYQQSPDWVAYKEFNGLRSNLLDFGFPNYFTNQELYESLNISYEDMLMFDNWDFADPEIFNAESMRKLVDAKSDRDIAKSVFLSTVVEFFLDYRFSSAMLIALIVCALTSRGKQRFHLVYSIIVLVCLQIYFVLQGRYGLNRIDVNLACCTFCILTIYAWGEIKPAAWLNWIFAVAILISPFAEYQPKQPVAVENTSYYELLASDQEHFYVKSVYTPAPELLSPLKVLPIGYTINSCSMGGWNTYTVAYLNKWEKYGVTNLFRDLVDNSKLYFVTTGDPEVHLNYIRGHYASEANGYLVKVTEDGYPIYRISTTGNPMIDTSKAVSANTLETIHATISVVSTETGYYFSGFLYEDNENSFASNIYLGITDDSGTETLHFVTQKSEAASGEYMNGEYGSFSTTLDSIGMTDRASLYLETSDTLYRLNLGTVAEMMQP